MAESAFLREVHAAVRLEVQRENLLEVLRARFAGQGRLAEAARRVELERDLPTLARWFRLALTAASADDFLARLYG